MVHQHMLNLRKLIMANITLVMRYPSDIVGLKELTEAFCTARANTFTMDDESLIPQIGDYQYMSSTPSRSGDDSRVESATAYFTCAARTFDGITAQIETLIVEIEKLKEVEVMIGEVEVNVSGSISARFNRQKEDKK